jgi:hypothetical protein
MVVVREHDALIIAMRVRQFLPHPAIAATMIATWSARNLPLRSDWPMPD